MTVDKQTQIDLLKTELSIAIQQTDKFDGMSSTIKGWAITLWAASVGWSFQVNEEKVLLLSILIILLFWFFDGLNKNFREDYKEQRNKVSGALEHLYRTGEIPADISAPHVPTHTWSKAWRRAALIHLALPYLILIGVSVSLLLL